MGRFDGLGRGNDRGGRFRDCVAREARDHLHRYLAGLRRPISWKGLHVSHCSKELPGRDDDGLRDRQQAGIALTHGPLPGK